MTLITQNVDDLHERAGFSGAIHMHGELRKVRCVFCGYEMEWEDDLDTSTVCPSCGKPCGMRPDIVWFGEIPYQMERIAEAVEHADMFIAIGTSGHVHPAAGLVSAAKLAGAVTVEINNAHTLVSGLFNRQLIGPASVEVPRWVEELLARGFLPR